MKKNLLIVLPIVVLFGCGLFGANPSPPSQFESDLFDVKTNFVQVVLTNTVSVTNQIPMVVYHTNEVGVSVTNVVIIPQVVPQVVTVTSTVPQYVWTTKPVVADTAQAAGSITNMIVPGLGSLVAGIIIGVGTLYAKLRSSKKTGVTLVQDIENIKAFLNRIPNGAQYVEALMNFTQAHQVEAGVLFQVINILKNDISNNDAQAAATEVQNAIAALSNPLPATPVVVKPVGS